MRRERSIDGHSRKTATAPVCIDIYKAFKAHVVKVERANCWRQGVVCWIKQAVKKYRQPLADALRVANCESTDTPSQINPTPVADGEHAEGLFQFLPSTWRSTPYRNRDIFSAKWNSLAAMWMWSVGRRGEWSCQ